MEVLQPLAMGEQMGANTTHNMEKYWGWTIMDVLKQNNCNWHLHLGPIRQTAQALAEPGFLD